MTTADNKLKAFQTRLETMPLAALRAESSTRWARRLPRRCLSVGHQLQQGMDEERRLILLAEMPC